MNSVKPESSGHRNYERVHDKSLALLKSGGILSWEMNRHSIQVGLIERGVPHRGVPQKCVRGRASGATVRLGHVLRGFIYSTIETRHFDTYPNRFDTYRIRIHARLRCVWKRFPTGTPLRGTTPYDYSRQLWVSASHHINFILPWMRDSETRDSGNFSVSNTNAKQEAESENSRKVDLGIPKWAIWDHVPGPGCPKCTVSPRWFAVEACDSFTQSNCTQRFFLGNRLRVLCGNDTVAVAMHFAMKSGQICFSLQKFLAISSAIQKIASDCGCDAVVHLVMATTNARNSVFSVHAFDMGRVWAQGGTPSAHQLMSSVCANEQIEL